MANFQFWVFRSAFNFLLLIQLKPGYFPHINIIFRVLPSSVLAETQPAHLLLTFYLPAPPSVEVALLTADPGATPSMFYDFELKSHQLQVNCRALCTQPRNHFTMNQCSTHFICWRRPVSVSQCFFNTLPTNIIHVCGWDLWVVEIKLAFFNTCRHKISNHATSKFQLKLAKALFHETWIAEVTDN